MDIDAVIQDFWKENPVTSASAETLYLHLTELYPDRLDVVMKCAHIFIHVGMIDRFVQVTDKFALDHPKLKDLALCEQFNLLTLLNSHLIEATFLSSIKRVASKASLALLYIRYLYKVSDLKRLDHLIDWLETHLPLMFKNPLFFVEKVIRVARNGDFSEIESLASDLPLDSDFSDTLLLAHQFGIHLKVPSASISTSLSQQQAISWLTFSLRLGDLDLLQYCLARAYQFDGLHTILALGRAVNVLINLDRFVAVHRFFLVNPWVLDVDKIEANQLRRVLALTMVRGKQVQGRLDLICNLWKKNMSQVPNSFVEKNLGWELARGLGISIEDLESKQTKVPLNEDFLSWSVKANFKDAQSNALNPIDPSIFRDVIKSSLINFHQCRMLISAAVSRPRNYMAFWSGNLGGSKEYCSDSPVVPKLKVIRDWLHIYQYWNDEIPPSDVLKEMDRVRDNNDCVPYTRFNDKSAREFISEHADTKFLTLWDGCKIPAFRADILRIILLKNKGGIWVDADTQSMRSIQLIPEQFFDNFTISCLDEFYSGYYANNDVLISPPSHGVTSRLYESLSRYLVENTINFASKVPYYSLVGPGAWTAALAHQLVDHELDTRKAGVNLLSRRALAEFFSPFHAQYQKDPLRNWRSGISPS